MRHLFDEIYIIYNRIFIKGMSRKHAKKPKNSHILLTTTTWSKQSHGLFDYQAPPLQNYNQELFYLENQCKVYRNPRSSNTIILTNNDRQKKMPQGTFQIASLHVKRQNSTPSFAIRPVSQKRKENSVADTLQEEQDIPNPFLVVKDFVDDDGTNGCPLQPGNILKLGRLQYLVLELKNNDGTLTLRDTNHFQQTNGTLQVKGKMFPPDFMCKVCLCEEDEPDTNPLIAPCKCKGSCQVIHVDCLKTWINSKVKKQLMGVATTYNFTKFQCQICKFPFPKVIQIEKNTIQMMTIAKPDKPYMILQSKTTKIDSKQQRCLYLIMADQNNPIKIGRGHNCEIRVTDISVSRSHAQIIYSNNKFYIRDMNSKFGTLVKFQNELNIKQSRPIKLQLGRSTFQFTVQGESQQVDTQ